MRTASRSSPLAVRVARFRFAPLALLAVLSSTASTRAQHAPALRLECPDLPSASRAALEARALAEMASVARPAADVTIRCDATGVAVSVRWDGTERQQRTVNTSAEPGAAVDAALEALHQALGEPLPSTPVPSLPTVPGLGSALPPRLVEEKDIPGPAPVLAHRLDAFVGADAELWSGSGATALGPHLGGRFLLSPRTSIVAYAGPAWAVGLSTGVHAFEVHAFAGLDYELWPRLPLGLGATGRALWASVDGGTSPGQGQGLTAGVAATARYRAPLGPVDVSAGPTLELLARPIVVDVTGTESFRVPDVLLSATLDISTR